MFEFLQGINKENKELHPINVYKKQLQSEKKYDIIMIKTQRLD